DYMASQVDGHASTTIALQKLVDGFDEEPLSYGKRMRELFQSDPGHFRDAAIAILDASPESKGWRYLVTLLWTNDLLVPILSDPHLPPKLGPRLAQSGLRIAPQLHIRLMRTVVDSRQEGEDFDERACNHMLEVLSSIQDTMGL